jgi:peptide deformylase
VLVIDITPEGEEKKPLRMANPEIVWVSDDDMEQNEGCLSVPEHYADVVRPAEVKVRYLDENDQQQELHATGLLSTCVQHEIDHLDGVLFIDRISALRRNMILRKLLKARRESA